MLSKRNYKHIIKINNAKSINLNAYLLLKTYFNKQVKQVIELLNKRLIHKSLNSWNFSILFIKKSEDW